MTPFTRLCGIAAPLPLANIDTDQIVPKQFLKTIDRKGLATALFYDQRHDAEGRATGDFVLDKAPWTDARILIAGDNFGCGSSREHAPWALIDFGIRCVVSSRIADIFFSNSVNNGLLPVTVEPVLLDRLMAAAEAGETFCVDLETCTISAGDTPHPFTIDPRVRARLLAGLDPVGESLAAASDIAAVEVRLEQAMPWLPRSPQLEVRHA